MISIAAVSKKYRDKNGDDLEILKQANLEVHSGEMVSIIGASGSGKSTLLHVIGGLDQIDSGKIVIDKEDISTYKKEKLAAFRNQKIGFVFQFHHLLPEFTALENVAMPSLISGDSYKVACSKAESFLNLVGMEHRLSHRPSELSGGEQQRVAIARALINKPKILLADEPTGNLDSKNAGIVLDLFFDIQKQTGITLIMVTHDQSIAKRTDRMFELFDGVLNKV